MSLSKKWSWRLVSSDADILSVFIHSFPAFIGRKHNDSLEHQCGKLVGELLFLNDNDNDINRLVRLVQIMYAIDRSL